MNPARKHTRAALIVGLVCAPALAAAQERKEVDLPTRMEQADPTITQAEVRDYYLRTWPNSSADEQLKFARLGIAQAAGPIVMYGLVAAERFAQTHPQRCGDLPLQQIEALARKHASAEVRGQAARAWYLCERPAQSTQNKLAQMLDSERDDAAAVQLVKLTALDGVSAAELDSLLRASQRAPSRTVERAILTVVLQPDPTPAVLPALINFIENPRYFANANLVGALPKFEKAAVQYLPRLERMQAELASAVAAAPDDRTVTLYNEQVQVDTLQRTIAELRRLQ